MAADILAGMRCVRHPASYFVWLPLAEEVRADQVAASLMREGISVATAEPYSVSPHVPHAIRLALGSVERDVLRDSLETVRRVIGEYAY
jgi:DNA-binding transcriptional MocR family regulator